jgi:magnesium transporter
VHVLTDLEEDRIAELRRREHFFWLDLADPSADQIATLGRVLNLHPMAMEDTMEFGQRPKVDGYEDHALLVYYCADARDGDVRAIEVHLYLAAGYAITIRREPCPPLDELCEELARDPEHDPGQLVYRILDTLTDAYFPAIDFLEEQVDALEVEVLSRPRREQLIYIYRLRQQVRELLRLATAERDLQLPEQEEIPAEYLRDVQDHITQATGELERQVEDLHALTDTYFNANATRLNATATRLTIIGTLFFAMTLFTGFFGQNFGWMVDHIGSAGAFWGLGVALPFTITALAGAVMWVKRRDLF